MGSLSLLQGIFPTQESNWGLLHCRRILYQLSHPGSAARAVDRNLLAMQKPQFNPWVGKIPWRRDRLPTPVFLGFPGSSAGKKLHAVVVDVLDFEGCHLFGDGPVVVESS